MNRSAEIILRAPSSGHGERPEVDRGIETSEIPLGLSEHGGIRLPKWNNMVAHKKQPVYYVVFCTPKYASFAEAKTKEPDQIAAHIRRSKELHEQGALLMAGAFLDKPDEPLSTMAVATSREAAEQYLKGDPFYIIGMMSQWSIREWANMFV